MAHRRQALLAFTSKPPASLRYEELLRRKKVKWAEAGKECDFPLVQTWPDDYNDHMIAKLRDAKEQLSELVKRAAGGEEIIITVRGQPMARLSAAKPATGSNENGVWARELAINAKSARRGVIRTTPQSAWDELRGER